MLIPTDLDIRSFTRGLNKTNNSLTWLGLGFIDRKITSFISSKTLPSSKISVLGFPVRTEFNLRYDKIELRKKFKIKPDKKVVLLMMGAAGSSALLTYIKALNSVRLDSLHIIVCLGRSLHLAKSISQLPLSSSVSYTLWQKNNSIAQAMAIADVCISKPGSVTFCETLYSNLPVFLDATSPLLVWEAFNTSFLRRHIQGKVIHHYPQVPRLIERFFNDNKWANQLKNNTLQLDKRNFTVQLPSLINVILNNIALKKTNLGYKRISS